jgi:hypothetical protein
MTVIRVKGVKRYRSKGRWYAYHRATGTRLKSESWTGEFLLKPRSNARSREGVARHAGHAARLGSQDRFRRYPRAISFYFAGPGCCRAAPPRQKAHPYRLWRILRIRATILAAGAVVERRRAHLRRAASRNCYIGWSQTSPRRSPHRAGRPLIAPKVRFNGN